METQVQTTIEEKVEQINPADIKLSHDIEVYFENNGEGKTPKIFHINTEVFIYDENLEDSEGFKGDFKKAGELIIRKVRHLYECHYDDVWKACDSVSQGLIDAFTLCFKNLDNNKDDGHIVSRTVNGKEKSFESFIFIEWLSFDTNLINSSASREIFKRITEDLGGNSLFVINPAEIVLKNKELSYDELITVFSSLGFKSIKKGGFHTADSKIMIES